MVKEYCTDKFNLYFGVSFNLFGIGFEISKYSINFTIGFFWLGFEW